VCNEQTSINYQATVENQNKIADLDKRLHDAEMLIDDMEHRLRNALERISMIEFYRRNER
jgi:hypothetical protein